MTISQHISSASAVTGWIGQVFKALAAIACVSGGLVLADDAPLPGPLTAAPGNAGRGLAILRDGSKPSCLICHQIPSLPDPGQGQIGPSLAGVATRYSEAELRQRIMDARLLLPDTIMPPYYSTEGLFRVGQKWRGQTIYEAQDVEDVLAFLLTLDE